MAEVGEECTVCDRVSRPLSHWEDSNESDIQVPEHGRELSHRHLIVPLRDETLTTILNYRPRVRMIEARVDPELRVNYTWRI